MEKIRQDFPKSEKVREKAEIDRIFRTGARFSCKGMVVRCARNSLEGSRAVFVASRNFKGAVQRNRAKRIAREVWRLNKTRVASGYDVAFVLYPGFDSFDEYSPVMLFLLRKAGLVR